MAWVPSRQRTGAARFLPSDANLDESFDLGVTDSSCSSSDAAGEVSPKIGSTFPPSAPAVTTANGADASGTLPQPTAEELAAAAAKRKLQRKLENRQRREEEKRLQREERRPYAAMRSADRHRSGTPRGRTVRQELDRNAYASLGIAAALEAPRSNSSTAVDPNAFLVLDLERRMYTSPNKVAIGKGDAGAKGTRAQKHRMEKLLDRAAALGRGPGGSAGNNSPPRGMKPTSLRPSVAAITASPRTFHGISLRDRDCRDGFGDTSSDDSTETPAARRRRHEADGKQRACDADARSRAEVESRAADLGLFQAFMTRTPSPTLVRRGEARTQRSSVNPLPQQHEEAPSPARFAKEEFDGELYGVRLSQPPPRSAGWRDHRASCSDPFAPAVEGGGGKVFGSPPSRIPTNAVREALERPIVEFSMSPGGGGVGFMASPLNNKSNLPSIDDESDSDEDSRRKRRHEGKKKTNRRSPSPRKSGEAKKAASSPSSVPTANPLLRETPKRAHSMFDDDDGGNGSRGATGIGGQYYGVTLSSAAVSAAWRAAEEERGTRDKAARFVDGPTLFRTLAS